MYPRSRGALVAFLSASLLQAANAAEPTPNQKLDATERSLATARHQHDALAAKDRSLRQDLDGLQRRSVELARTTQDNEAQLSGLEEKLTLLDADLVQQRATLEAKRASELRALAAIERLAAAPPEARVFAPGSPVDVARGGMLLGAVIPTLKIAVQEHAAAEAKLRDTVAAVSATRDQVNDHERSLIDQREALAQLQTERQALEADTRQKADAAQKQVAALAAEAHDLRQLVERLEREHQSSVVAEAAPPPQPDRPNPHEPALSGSSGGGLQPGAMLSPVAGDIVRQFGSAEATGTAKGLTFAARRKATVVAPYDGEIMFAGPFRGYGQILIIDHGAGYHSLLAGIDQVSVTVGRKVIAGEPVGTMSADGQPNLYLELRHQGETVNPLPWLVAREGKVSG